ncbi:MAG TPA: hypothetical protein VHY22_15770 [Chthoniobacteraceae bacterium]|nr:hypothetical protein [Chthoniobacteraceae bacterium]
MRFIDQEKFEKIVRFARRTNPFYARWIPPGGPVPIMTRRMVLENNTELLNGHPVAGMTSGSSGMPVNVASGPDRGKMEIRDNMTILRWLGGPMPRLPILYPLEWRPRKNLIPISTPIPQQAEGIRDFASRHDIFSILTYPSNAKLLAQYLGDKGISFPSVHRVLLMSEPLDSGQRALIRQAFPNALIWITYSATELGIISCQCPFEPDFQHIMSHKLGVEIVDAGGQAVPFGQVGRLVCTDYYNCQMPFIRYALGDLASFGQCPCGKIPLPAFSQVLGKVRGALLHRDGRRETFAFFADAFEDLPGIRQYQVIQEAIHRFTVNLVITQKVDAEVRAIFLKEFGYENQVDIVYMDEIPRDPNGKFYASICKV